MRLFTKVVFSVVMLVAALPLAGTASAQGFNSIDSRANLTYFNARPIPLNAYRVLFIGDSLTYHAQTPKLWDYVSGMAASSPAKDFVHLASAHMQKKIGERPVEILIDNGGNGRIGAMLDYLTAHPEFKPSLVVLQGGENDAFDSSFQKTYKSLLDFYRAERIPYIVLGDWWAGSKSNFDHQETQSRGYVWVDLTQIAKDPTLSGDSGPYNVPGVAKHPNDKGMQAIADAINSGFDKAILPSLHK